MTSPRGCVYPEFRNGKARNETSHSTARGVNAAPRARSFGVRVWRRTLCAEPVGKGIEGNRIEPELRNRNGERTRPACRSGRPAQALVSQFSLSSPHKKVRGTRFSAGRRKRHASGVRSPRRGAASNLHFGVRVEFVWFHSFAPNSFAIVRTFTARFVSPGGRDVFC